MSNQHRLVLCDLNIKKPCEIPNKITFRGKKNLNPYELIEKGIQGMIVKNADICRCHLAKGDQREENRIGINSYTMVYIMVFSEEYNEVCAIIEKKKKDTGGSCLFQHRNPRS